MITRRHRLAFLSNLTFKAKGGIFNPELFTIFTLPHPHEGVTMTTATAAFGMTEQVRIGRQPPKVTDEELVARYLSGDAHAFTELDNRYRNRLRRFADRKIYNWDQAEDLVQEAFVRIARHLHKFDQSKKFSTWAHTIVNNLVKNELRNRSKTFVFPFSVLSEDMEVGLESNAPDLKSNSEELFYKNALQVILEEAIEKLPKHQRLVVRLREIEGKSYEEVAKILHIKLGTVKSRLNRGRVELAKLVLPCLN